MRVPISRRSFVAAGPSAATFAALVTVIPGWVPSPGRRSSDEPSQDAGSSPPVHPEFPAQRPDLVREVVAVSHGNIDRVRELVEPMPELAKAWWDWGFGDWESALGAASHVGRPDIAEVLMAHGARPNIFTAAMMGNLDAVKAFIGFDPGIQRVPGPHGITLLSHAKVGGDAARPVVEYLESVGGADERPAAAAISDEEKNRYLGVYAYGPEEDERVEVMLSRDGGLGLRRGDGPHRRLHRVEGDAFFPSGAPSVRITFTIEQDAAVAVTVHAPAPIMVARRVHA